MLCLLHILGTMYLKILSVSFFLGYDHLSKNSNHFNPSGLSPGGPFLASLWVRARVWPGPDRGREDPGASETFAWKTEARGVPL